MRDLECFHQVALDITSAEEREEALLIWIARDARTFRAWTKLNRDAAGVFLATSLGNLAFITSQGTKQAKDGEVSSRHILFHEYTHYLMASNGARVPSWYNEGFAEYLGATEFTAEGTYRLGCPPRFRTRWQGGHWIPMAELMAAANVAKLSGESCHPHCRHRAGDPYAQSWYAVHYFNESSERQQQLARYLELYGRGAPSERATREAFGMDPGALDAALKAHAAQTSFPCVELRSKRTDAPKEPEVHPISTAEAHYRVGQFLLATYSGLETARDALERALTLEPRNAHVLVALARAHVMLANRMAFGESKSDPAPELEHARAYLARTKALAPNDAERHTIEGDLRFFEAQLALERKDTAAAHSTVAAARSAYRNAVHLDVTLAEALIGLGYTYLLEDDGAEEGVVALEGAAYLLPLNTDLAFALARLHFARKQPGNALAPLEHVVRWAKNEEQREKAQAMIDEISTAKR